MDFCVFVCQCFQRLRSTLPHIFCGCQLQPLSMEDIWPWHSQTLKNSLPILQCPTWVLLLWGFLCSIAKVSREPYCKCLTTGLLLQPYLLRLDNYTIVLIVELFLTTVVCTNLCQNLLHCFFCFQSPPLDFQAPAISLANF